MSTARLLLIKLYKRTKEIVAGYLLTSDNRKLKDSNGSYLRSN